MEKSRFWMQTYKHIACWASLTYPFSFYKPHWPFLFTSTHAIWSPGPPSTASHNTLTPPTQLYIHSLPPLLQALVLSNLFSLLLAPFLLLHSNHQSLLICLFLSFSNTQPSFVFKPNSGSIETRQQNQSDYVRMESTQKLYYSKPDGKQNK